MSLASGTTTGGLDVYVRPFPGPGGRWRIFTTGSAFPRWSATAPELLFLKKAIAFLRDVVITQPKGNAYWA